MSSQARPALAPTQAPLATPQCPTLVFTSFKGGVCKTSLAVAAAELLAYQGLHVLLITSDQQHDAHVRLGLSAHASDGEVQRGDGKVEVLGVVERRLAKMLYGEQFSAPVPDVVVIDTPPDQKYASLQGVMLAVPVDGSDDTQRNVRLMLANVPANSQCVLLGMSSKATDSLNITDAEWKAITRGLKAGLPKNIDHLPKVMKLSNEVADVHASRDCSVWQLDRRTGSRTFTFLSGVHELCVQFHERYFPSREWVGAPAIEPSRPRVPAIRGFDQ